MEKLIAAFIIFIGAIIVGLAGAFGIAAISAFFVKWLWNYAVVDMFAMHRIDFWHAFALAWLCSLLFKGTVNVNKSDK